MHDPEKSDSGIVAMKPMNKAGRPAAELAEPRPGTKGNADQQSTHRTQSRARVTQALDRVRKAARRRKKEQFTSLLHHMNGYKCPISSLAENMWGSSIYERLYDRCWRLTAPRKE